MGTFNRWMVPQVERPRSDERLPEQLHNVRHHRRGFDRDKLGLQFPTKVGAPKTPCARLRLKHVGQPAAAAVGHHMDSGRADPLGPAADRPTCRRSTMDESTQRDRRPWPARALVPSSCRDVVSHAIVAGSGGEGVTSSPEPQTTAAHGSGHSKVLPPAGWRWPSWDA